MPTKKAKPSAPSQKMILVDAYWIPENEAGQYIAAREETARRLTQAIQSFCPGVERCWAGSEDGEAVVGLDSKGELMVVMHLDPYTIEEVQAMTDEELLSYLQRL